MFINISLLAQKVSYLQCRYKKMSTTTKNIVEKFDEGVPTRKVAQMFNGGGISFL